MRSRLRVLVVIALSFPVHACASERGGEQARSDSSVLAPLEGDSSSLPADSLETSAPVPMTSTIDSESPTSSIPPAGSPEQSVPVPPATAADADPVPDNSSDSGPAPANATSDPAEPSPEPDVRTYDLRRDAPPWFACWPKECLRPIPAVYPPPCTSPERMVDKQGDLRIEDGWRVEAPMEFPLPASDPTHIVLDGRYLRYSTWIPDRAPPFTGDGPDLLRTSDLSIRLVSTDDATTVLEFIALQPFEDRDLCFHTTTADWFIEFGSPTVRIHTTSGPLVDVAPP
jgi:hypothetical protein